MDQPNTESEQKQNTEATPQETSTETNQATSSDQPAEESGTVQSGLDSLRKKLGLNDPGNENEEEETPGETKNNQEEKPEAKAEPVKEEKKASASDLPDEIEIEDTGKLVKVVNDLGITVYTTPEKAEEAKKGLLLQSDYTKKTQALSEERKSLETARSSFIQQVKDFSKIHEEMMYGSGFSEPEPLESEYVDAFADDDEKREQLSKYREDKQKWLDAKDTHQEKRADLIAKQKSANIENTQNSEKFISEFGKEALEEIYPELMEIKSALNTTGTVPFPKDMLRYYYLGRNFDKMVAKKVEEATANMVEKISKGANKSAKISRSGQALGESKSGDNYDNYKNKVKAGNAGSW